MKNSIFFFFALLSCFSKGEAFAQETDFSRETFSFGNITLPYREATFPGPGDKASLVIYLHGGSSKGNDNETQMQEPGISAVGTWLAENKRKAVMLVPQCPADKSWLGTVQDVVVRLLQSFINRGLADADKVYIFGGSMGGTGTWNMIASHPELFAAAMPVAGNPAGLDAAAVSRTPVFTVMGTADNIMKISNVEAFLKEMDGCGAEYRFNIEEGWTHEDVCKKSYTDERLNWVFKHTKHPGTTDAIAVITGVNGEYGTAKVVWHSVGGQQLAGVPAQKGIYIKTTVKEDGSSLSEKYYVK